MIQKYPAHKNLDEKSIRDWRKDPALQPEESIKNTGTGKKKKIRRYKSPYNDQEDKLIAMIQKIRGS